MARVGGQDEGDLDVEPFDEHESCHHGRAEGVGQLGPGDHDDPSHVRIGQCGGDGTDDRRAFAHRPDRGDARRDEIVGRVLLGDHA